MTTTPEQIVLARIIGDLGAIDTEISQERAKFENFLKQKEADRERLLSFKRYLEGDKEGAGEDRQLADEREEHHQEELTHKTGTMYAETALQQIWRPLDTKSLLAKMQDIGFVPGAANPYVSLFSTLRRSSQRPGSRIIKRDGLWGLSGWSDDIWAQGEGRSHAIDVEALNNLRLED
jgi:hypothetical protein